MTCLNPRLNPSLHWDMVFIGYMYYVVDRSVHAVDTRRAVVGASFGADRRLETPRIEEVL